MKTKLMTRLLCFILFAVMMFGCLAACKDEPNKPIEDINGGGNGNGTVEEGPVEFVCATMCTAPSTVKVLQRQEYTSDSQTLSFKGFRNEYENAQVIFTAKTDILSYDVELSDLKCGENTLSKDCFTVYNQKYIIVSEIKDILSGTVAGAYPDALLPLDVAIEYGETQVRKGLNQGIWFNVNIGADQAAGVYTGKFALTINGETKEFPVEVTVWDYVLPSETHQKSCFAVYDDALARGELAWTLEMEELYAETLLNYRLQPQSLPTGLGHRFNPSASELATWLDSLVKYTQDERVTWINIPYKKTDGKLSDGTAAAKGSLVDFQLYEDVLVMILKRSAKEGVNLMEKLGLWLTCVDEADYREKPKEVEYITSELKKIQQRLYDTYIGELEAGTLWLGKTVEEEFIREVLEDMRVIQAAVTMAQTNSTNNPDFMNFEYPFTQWVQLWHFHTEERRELLEAENNRYNEFYGTDTAEVWMYTGVYPPSPNPTLHIDDTLLTTRAMGWMLQQYNIAGHQMWYTNLYYDMENGWDGVMSDLQDCYQTANRYPASNGDGFIFYPGANYGIEGPVVSIRLEALRDSMEDYEVFYMMEQIYKEYAEKNNIKYTDEEFISLVEFLATGYYSGTLVQIGDELASNFGTLREALVAALDLLTMGVRITDFEKGSAIITLTMEAPEGVTVSLNGTAIAPANGKIVATIDLSKGSIATISATNGTKTVSGNYWLGAPYREITADKVGNYVSAGGNPTQLVQNDAACGKDAFRIDLKIGTQDLIINTSKLGIDNISQSLWLDIYNDSDQTLTFNVLVKKKNANYKKVYEGIHLDLQTEYVTVTLEPGMNHVEINGYALVCGDSIPKGTASPESVKLTIVAYTTLKIAITNMYVEKG